MGSFCFNIIAAPRWNSWAPNIIGGPIKKIAKRQRRRWGRARQTMQTGKTRHSRPRSRAAGILKEKGRKNWMEEEVSAQVKRRERERKRQIDRKREAERNPFRNCKPPQDHAPAVPPAPHSLILSHSQLSLSLFHGRFPQEKLPGPVSNTDIGPSPFRDSGIMHYSPYLFA